MPLSWWVLPPPPAPRLEAQVLLDADGLNNVVRSWVDRHPGGLVIVDSLSATLPPGINIDKAAAARPVRELVEALGDGWGILTHHMRKAAGKEGNLGVGAGSPRNLIDTGNLRQTGSFRMVGPTAAVFTWSASYATAVHEGAYIFPWGNKQAARVYLPPRPWTRAVLGAEDVPGIRAFPVAERLRDVWLQALRKGS